MNADLLIQKYIKCAEICSKINYLDKKSVVNNNTAITKMYKMLREFKTEFNNESVELLYPLLENELTAKWAAHQLLEIFNAPKYMEDKALITIKELINNPLNDSRIGEEIWLKNYTSLKNKNANKGELN